MDRMIFVNLPVADLPRSKAFFAALGFRFNAQFTNADAAAMKISDTIYAMLMAAPFFRTFTRKEVADAARTTEVLVCISAESRTAVDELADAALAAGGKAARDPQDYGFMYARSFEDLDGHIWEVMWMDPAQVRPEELVAA